MNRFGIDTKQLWAEVQENHRKVRDCPRHHFTNETVNLGERISCQNCGGTLRLPDIGQYIAGYEAAGGDAADIWPAYARDAAKKAREATPVGEANPNRPSESGA